MRSRKTVSGIGGTVSAYRQKKGMKLVELARSANLGKGLISKIETTPNYDAKLSTLTAIATGFNMTLSAFIRWHQENT